MKPITLQEIIDELNRATEKHLEWPSDAIHAAAIIGEEYGEMCEIVDGELWHDGANSSVIIGLMEHSGEWNSLDCITGPIK